MADFLDDNSARKAQQLKSDLRDIKEVFADINRTAGSSMRAILAGIGGTIDDISKSVNKIKDLDKESKISSQATLEALKEKNTQLTIASKLNEKINKLYAEARKETGEAKQNLLAQAQNLSQAKSLAKELANSFDDIANQSAKLNKSTIFFSELAKATGNIKGLKSFSAPFEAAAKASKEQFLNNNKIKINQENIAKLTNNQLTTGRGLTAEKLKELGLSEITQGKTNKAAAKLLKTYQTTSKTSSSMMAGLNAGMKAVGASFSSFFKGGGWIRIAIEVVKFIKDAMFGASKQIAEFQRGLMVSSEEAEKIRQRAYDISAESSNLADTQGKVIILQKQIVEAMNATNNALDTQIDFTQNLGEFGEKILAQSAILKDNMGLEAEAQAEITRESIRTGKEIEQITKSSYGNIAAIGLGKKIQFDVNKLLTEATKIQGNLRLSYKGSTEELAKAVAQSKLLGVNLSQLEKVQSNLLNFEESISAELEAELLSGRDFNLERARTLALEGNLVGMAEALNAQGITYNKLQSYNIIQRQAIAKALGMEVNELADALKKQEEYNQLQLRAQTIGIETSKLEKQSLQEIFEEGKKIGRSEEEIIKSLGEEIYQRKLAEDAQTKFNKALEMAKEQFQSFVTSGVLDKFASFLTVFVNKVAKDGLGSALFADYGEEITQEQLKYAENKVKNESGKNNAKALDPAEIAASISRGEKISDSQKDMLVARKNVLEEEKITGLWENITYGLDYSNPFKKGAYFINKEKDEEIAKLNKILEQLDENNTKLNQQLEKGITATSYLDSNRLGTNMNIAATKLS